MKDWKAVVRTWEKRTNFTNREVRKQYGRQEVTDQHIRDLMAMELPD
jgi:hypothetical protein